MKRKIILYNPKLKRTARVLRKNSTLSEILLWNELKGKKMLGFDFDRQKPIGNYVIDFFCKKLMLAIEIDGDSHSDRIKKDESRQAEIEKRGIKFLRFEDTDIKHNLRGVCDSIRDWIEEIHPEPTPSLRDTPPEEGTNCSSESIPPRPEIRKTPEEGTNYPARCPLAHPARGGEL